MSREILFRGKRQDNGEWEYGVPLISESGEIAYMTQMHSYNCRVEPQTIGQFTGLTDKNGNKIFEGDIVRGKNYLGLRREGVIEYDVYDATYKIVPKTKSKYRESKTTEILYPADILEVIGNIFDNAELLQEK